MKYLFTLTAEIDRDAALDLFPEDEALAQRLSSVEESDAAAIVFDHFREAVLPSHSGVTLWGLEQVSGNEFKLNAEIEADSPEQAVALFDQMRETFVCSDYGLTLYGLTPVDSSPRPKM